MISGNETLRAHMYKQHQISRMFMCRCCNWAFPDKTSLHMHIQAREEGKSITVPVIGKGLAPDGVDSPYANLHPINNNTLPQMQNPGVLTPTPGLSFFSAPPPPLTSSAEDMSRLRDRLVLNSLMTQPGFGLAAAWLNNLPKPIPTTKPLVDLMKKESREEDECEVNVENDSAHTDDDKNVDSRFVISPSHVSPSETHSSASPNGCYDCAVYKTKLTMADNKCRYLESRGNTLQEQAVRFMQCDRASNPQAVALFMNHLIQSTIIR
ncbi:hypothetical protein OSTOST_03401 [Ostertagia ostertagi]